MNSMTIWRALLIAMRVLAVAALIAFAACAIWFLLLLRAVGAE